VSSRFSRLVLVLLLVGLIFLCGAAFFLWRGWQAYRAITGELESQHVQLVRLQARSPYPSEGNVKTVAQNAARMEGFLSELITSLRTNQVQPVRIEPADFPAILEKDIRYLSRKAAEAEVILPEDFTFGFERYVRGQIPAASLQGGGAEESLRLRQVVNHAVCPRHRTRLLTWWIWKVTASPFPVVNQLSGSCCRDWPTLRFAR